MSDDELRPFTTRNRSGLTMLRVDHVLDHDGELEIELEGPNFQTFAAYLDVDKVRALRDHLNAVLRTSNVTEPVWATGWYKRKRHLVADGAKPGHQGVRAHCSEHTYLYTTGARQIPLPNTDEVMKIPACKICERKAAQ